MTCATRVVGIALVTLSVVACGGSVRTTSAQPTSDGGSSRWASDSGDRSSDSGVVPTGPHSGDARTACNPASPFGTPTALPDLSSAGRDDGLSFSPDGLAVYLSSDRLSTTGYDQIFAATTGAGETLSAPALVAGIAADAGPESDYAPWISADGLRLYFSSYRDGSSHVYFATRAAVTAEFQPPQLVPAINSATSTTDKDEYLTPDEENVYLSSDRLGPQCLFWATRSGGETFGEPTELSELLASPPADDHSPVVSADQLMIFFASNRSGNVDIWTASRSTTATPFGAPVEATTLNIGAVDYPLWLSSDACTLYIAAGPYEAMHFYKATRGI